MLNHEEEQRNNPVNEIREIATPLPQSAPVSEIDKWERLIDRAIPLVDRVVTLTERFMEGRNAGQQRQRDIEAIPLHRSGYRVSEEGVVPLNPQQAFPQIQPHAEPVNSSSEARQEEPLKITDNQLEYLWEEAIAGLRNLGSMPVNDAVTLAENNRETVLATIRERLNQLNGETVSDSGVEG